MTQNSLEVTPTTLVYGGDALARLPDGRAVFIPFALPGELCRIRVVEEKERYARAELLEVLSGSPHRVKPRCLHFQECGGCHYQHINYQEQLSIKSAILADQLERVGKITDPPVKDIVAAPQEWNYRNHVQFHIDRGGNPGFHQHRSDHIVAVQECHLLEDSLNQIWPALDLEFISGLERVSLRAGEDGGDTIIVFECSDPQPMEFEIDLPLSVVLQGPGGEMILSGDDFTVIPVHQFPFVVSASSFFQVNTRMAELLVDHLLDALPLNPEQLVLDVYSGVGLFSVFLAPYVKEVIAIESHPSAADDFLYNLSEFENVTFYDSPAEDVLGELDVNPDIIILDPPRSGLSRTVLDQVTNLKPSWIAYISCDPATLARDAARLIKQGYTLMESTPFDMFPQTYHIESLNIFQRASRNV
jgi:23S rRNA (uracil1939-C5)-methyltransferase